MILNGFELPVIPFVCVPTVVFRLVSYVLGTLTIFLRVDITVEIPCFLMLSPCPATWFLSPLFL